MVVIIRDRQTVTDIAVQALGSASAALEIAKLNNISLTDDLPPGTALQLPDKVNSEVVDFFTRTMVYPAMRTDASGAQGGIGYMQIGTDFIVS